MHWRRDDYGAGKINFGQMNLESLPFRLDTGIAPGQPGYRRFRARNSRALFVPSSFFPPSSCYFVSPPPRAAFKDAGPTVLFPMCCRRNGETESRNKRLRLPVQRCHGSRFFLRRNCTPDSACNHIGIPRCNPRARARARRERKNRDAADAVNRIQPA